MSDQAAVATPTKSGTATKALPRRQDPKPMPQWKVLLHNDDVNSFQHVIRSLMQVLHFGEQDAELRAQEAHEQGLSLLTVTYKEKAELYQEQLQSLSLTATIEPDESA